MTLDPIELHWDVCAPVEVAMDAPVVAHKKDDGVAVDMASRPAHTVAAVDKLVGRAHAHGLPLAGAHACSLSQSAKPATFCATKRGSSFANASAG